MNTESPDRQNNVVKIIILPGLDILVYVIPRPKASILADKAKKIHFKNIILILLKL